MEPNALMTEKWTGKHVQGVTHGAIQDIFSVNSVSVEMVTVEIRTAHI
jgi:hypothetical protein